MTVAGWIFMLTSWAIVAALTLWCFWRLLTSRRGFGEDEGGDGQA